ncbi:MAG: TonB family protein [Candidatus Obscuribacterales bacterium]|nr:TonB family protein [Candidatus Obscuribacterales bacterium]
MLSNEKRFLSLIFVAMFCAPVLAQAERPTANKLNDEGLIELEHGNYSAAISKFEKALQADPQCRSAKMNLVTAQGKVNPPVEELKYQGSWALVSGNFDLATKNLSAALEKDPSNKQIRDLLEAAKARAKPTESMVVNRLDTEWRIKRAWFPPKVCVEHPDPIVTFRMHSDGSVSNVKLEQSSTFESADNSCLRAIESAAPFVPLPHGYDHLDVRFNFGDIIRQRPRGTFRSF